MLYRHVAQRQTEVAQEQPLPVPTAPPSQTTLPTPSVIPEKSVAVLAFADMSEKKDQEYFSDGLAEQMIDLLSQLSDLRVPARTSSFYFKGKNEPIASIAQQLRVANVLEGSVRKAGKRLRVTAELIRADNGYHIWSQTYDRQGTDVFAVQDDIAKAVVTALKGKLEGTAADADASRGTSNTEAYNEFLRGRELDKLTTPEANRHAADAYEQAVALDGHFGVAYAALAMAEAFVADDTGEMSGIERAKQHAEQAIALAPTDARTYASRCTIRQDWLWDWTGAREDCEKALSLDPRRSSVQHDYATLLDTLGKLPEAIDMQKQGLKLDPVSVSAWVNLGSFYLEGGDYDAAEAAIKRGLELQPTHKFALYHYGALRLLEGRNQQALEIFRRLEPDILFRATGIAMAEAALGHAQASEHSLDEAIAKNAQSAAYQIAEVYAWRGDKDKAFAWLDRAYHQTDGGLSYLKGDPMLKSLRADPRYRALLIKMKLPV